MTENLQENLSQMNLTSDNPQSQDNGEESLVPQRPRNTPYDSSMVPRVTDTTGEQVKEAFQIFLESFTEKPDPNDLSSSTFSSSQYKYYVEQIHGMKQHSLTTLYIDYSHLLNFDETLSKAVAEQYYRFLPYLLRAIQALVKKFEPAYLYTNQSSSTATSSTGLTTREFSLAFYNLPLVHRVRELKTEKIGQLITISGTVTRTSEVRPELTFGTFICLHCKGVARDIEQQFRYTEPIMCQNPVCQNKRDWTLNIEQSKFTDWQRVRIQENANEIPTGSMPRTVDVILRGEMVERAKAGDKSVFTGTLIVVPDVGQLGIPGNSVESRRELRSEGRARDTGANDGVTGLKALGVRDLTYKLNFMACMVQSAEARNNGTNIRVDADAAEETQDAFMQTLTQAEIDELKEMVSDDRRYQKIVGSVAPTVYGHDIVKRGILLQLMGGVHKVTQEGINLRGDINICIVGDPSTSKSQFLKYVCGFLPRAVYTSGKASSAAGLTASVIKDEETGEFTIEAGALMLADNGLCAIDEFDKMDIADQVAIHEAMEQQTISIAKAGIQATLNARTSILAAANPIGGRYNRKISLKANIAMSAPIMSRFDLFFVVLDECNPTVDFNIAQHIVNVHRFKDDAVTPDYSTEQLQRYIRYARTFKPKLTPEASIVLVEKYRLLREDDAQGFGRNSYRITVRQLESMIRLSEAIARVHCTNEITPSYVHEAYTLLRQSIIHVEKDDIGLDDAEDPDATVVEDVENINDASMMDTDLGSGTTAVATPRSTKKISYEQYMEIMNMVVLHLSSIERETGQGLKRAAVIQWYLEQKEDTINTEDELVAESTMIEKVLRKLVKEQYLMEIRGDVQAESESSSQAAAMADPILLPHPSVEYENM